MDGICSGSSGPGAPDTGCGPHLRKKLPIDLGQDILESLGQGGGYKTHIAHDNHKDLFVPLGLLLGPE